MIMSETNMHFEEISQTRSNKVCSTAFQLKDNQKAVHCHNLGAVGENSIANWGQSPNCADKTMQEVYAAPMDY